MLYICIDDVFVPYTIMSYDLRLVLGKVWIGFTNGNVQDEVGDKKVCIYL